MASFKPWGELSWLMERLGGRKWAFIGCISHEERCLAALTALQGSDVSPTLIRIFDEDPVDEAEEQRSLSTQTEAAVRTGIPLGHIVDAQLLATIDSIESIVTKAVNGKTAAIVDITSFPKRWFFVIARLLKESLVLEDVIYTYSLGTKYATILSSNPEIVRTIPTFTSIDRRSSCDVAMVGIGYHSQSVLNLFDIERPKSVTMLFPFPPGPPGIARNWRFVERLELSIRSDISAGESIDLNGVGHLHLGALDLPQSFNAMRQITDEGTRTSLVAPYGPKPVSLAMCLFALAAESAGRPEVPAYYSQPTRYALDYTTGVLVGEGGSPTIYAYPTKLSARDLYVL
jgi:hypothetical protein